MKTIFPNFVNKLPLANIPLNGLKAFLAQEANNQILFMEFQENIEIAPHKHNAQWGIVLEGKIDLTIGGFKYTFSKGDRYEIPKDVVHSAKIYAGYADITIFNQKDRYKAI